MTAVGGFFQRLSLGLLRKMQARYEAGEDSYQHPLSGDKSSADGAASLAGDALRETARELEQNMDIVSGLFDTLCTKVVGTGLVPEPMVRLNNGEPATEFNERLADLWRTHSESVDVTGEHDSFAAQTLTCRTWLRDGEAFEQMFSGPVPGLPTSEVPFWVELLEPDFFDSKYNDPNRRIVQSVEKNGWGRPVRYHKLREHPGNYLRGGLLTVRRDSRGMGGSALDTRPIPAARMLHWKFNTRSGATRGVPIIASSIKRIRDLKDYDESERIKARVQAAICAAIVKQAAQDYQPATGPDGKPLPRRNLQFEPGVIFDDLREGEKLDLLSTNSPNPELVNHRNAQLRSFASGNRVAFSTVSRMYDASYSAMRQETVDTEALYRGLTKGFVTMGEHAKWRRFVQVATMTVLPVPRTVDRSTLFRVLYTPPGMPWVDPKKEIESDILAMTGGDSGMPLMAWSSVLRKRGLNPQETMEQLLEQEEFNLKLAEVRAKRMKIEREMQQEDDPDGQPGQTNSGESGGQAA